MFEELIGVAAKTAIDNRDEISSWLRKLSERIKKGKHGLAVLGAGGTGKSTLGKFLSGQTLDGTYRESLTVDEVAFEKSPRTAIYVLPGQHRRQAKSWPEVHSQLQKCRSCGILNVVAWGLHSLGDLHYTEHSTYKNLPQKTPSEFMIAYKKRQLESEIELLEGAYSSIRTLTNIKYTATIVTKEDLWWKERVNTRSHYMHGAYSKAISNTLGTLNSTEHAHEYLSTSLLPVNFWSGKDLLAATAEGYDSAQQAHSTDRLVRALIELIES